MTPKQTTTGAVVAVLAIALLGGGIAYASKDAKPGDMLYSIRASVWNDVSDDAEAQANLRSAADTYTEAETLEQNGQLTASERARLTAQYSLHVNAVLRRIATLEQQGDTEGAAELRASLRATLRTSNNLFPFVNSETASSASSSVTSSGRSGNAGSSTSDTSSSASVSSMQKSSIFVQPSSSVTSA